MVYENLEKSVVVRKVNNKIKDLVLGLCEDMLIEGNGCALKLSDIEYEFIEEDFEDDFVVTLYKGCGKWVLYVMFKNEVEDDYSDEWEDHLENEFVVVSYSDNKLNIIRE